MFLLGLFVGQRWTVSSQARGFCIREKSQGLINPLLGCEISKSDFPELRPIKDSLQNILAKYQPNGKMISTSVYLRLLNSGRWFDINGDMVYAPASLLKVPLLIAYFKIAEADPSVLSQTMYYDGRFETTEIPEIAQERRIKKNTSYTVGDLISHMIIDSSNVAMYILNDHLNQAQLKKVYDDLEITGPFQQKENFMSAKNYSFFFRVLYNTSYLSRELSQRALTMLTQTSYNNGITAKLPRNLVVAHKYGSRVYDDENPVKGELHECGIVYYPEHPYLLCIMTTSYSSQESENLVSDLSLAAYNAINDFFTKK